MNRFFTRLATLFVLLLSFGKISAQQKADYHILVKSGKFIPAENRNTNAVSLKNSIFGNRQYVTIQFGVLPDEAAKKRMAAVGIQLIDYIPNLAFTAAVPAGIDQGILSAFNIRSIFQFSAKQKAEADVLNGPVPPHAGKLAGHADINVLTYEQLGIADVSTAFSNTGAVILQETPVFRTFTVRIPAANISKLADLAFVQWIEFINPPNQPENLPGRTLHRANILNDGIRNLKGDGINIGIWDGGEVSPHIDFSPAGRRVLAQTSSPTSHGTHCAGTICGRGIINPLARGMAPNAKIYSYDYNGDVQAEMAAGIPANNLIVSSHSYNDGAGVQCGLTGTNSAYTLRSRNTDLNLNNFPSHLHVHSSGNNQSSCSGGWTTITGTGKSAKNNITVGALSSTDAMTNFSSFGPVGDGRIKPEICAMGLNVFSTYTPLNTYSTISGTSMSTPGAAGTVALLVQAYKQLNSDVLPPSSLIRNIVCNGARDLGNAGPDYKFGYGCIDALQSVKILEQNRYEVSSMSTGAVNNKIINVPSGTARLRVMLTWNDPAAAANANPAIVNNLDLTVNNGSTTLPWILNPNSPATPATRGVDNISNIEQVTIDNPAAGDYTLTVTGTSIPSGPQQYALTWTIDQPGIEITYPNGGESLNPGTSELITWDNFGVTGNQTVEYSLDNGSTWNVISSTVAATTTRLAWTVPAANTSRALVRVSNGALTDVSDANFRILGTTTGFTASGVSGCSAGQVIFNWNAVTNATNYDIYKLDNVTGYFVILAADVTGTTYTASGLNPGESMWFTIIAKNNSTGAASERALAVNATVSSGGGGLGVIGGITGQSNICGQPTSVAYSISPVTGATTYTWSVPPGASIVSGQGTTNVNISYPAGSSNGNLSVFAGNAVCQTPASTLAITIGSAAVTAPVSGGNQTVTLCAGDPAPTLTATATTGSGLTLIWYNASTGGTVVTNPVLSALGTITYYAASFNNTSGCESATRTAVTLTINASAPASITAGGPVSFCEGGTVLLTANTGTSYLWSNGATTQSITVTSSGSFTVTVTQTGGCTDISPATTVTVNALPVSTVTAGGPTTFCDGSNVILTASAGNSWLWSNGSTTQSITVTGSGNYSVTVTGTGGCSTLSAAVPVTVNANPPAVINAGSATTFCDGGQVVLTASPGNSYLWSNGATTSSITVNSSGSFSVAVTQNGGCISTSAATNVTVNPRPLATITANGATEFCEGNNVILVAAPGNSWLWSNGATSQSITVSSGGNYQVTVTDINGCSAGSASTSVAVSPNPVVSITASPYRKLYPGLTTTLTANVSSAGTFQYIWYKNGLVIPGATGSTLTGIDISDLGDYTVEVTNSNGLPCKNTSGIMAITDSVTSTLYIYPSPNNGLFNVAYYTSGANASNTLAVFDSKGARVYQRSYNMTSPYQLMNVDMRQNSSGVYMVVLFDRTGKKIAKGKVLIQ